MSYKMSLEEIENGFILVRPIVIGSGEDAQIQSMKKAIVFPSDSPSEAERVTTLKRAYQEMRFSLDTLSKEIEKQEPAKKTGK